MGSVHQRGVRQVRSGGVHRGVRPEVRGFVRQHRTRRSRPPLVHRSVQLPPHLLEWHRRVRGVGCRGEGQRGPQTDSRWLVLCATLCNKNVILLKL